MDPITWLQNLPPITRTWFGLSLAVHAATTLELIDHSDLLFDWNGMTSNLELWRVATSFLYSGGSLHEFHALIGLYMIIMQSSAYENNPHFAGGPPRADYVFCLFFCVTTTLLTYLLVDYYGRYYYEQRFLYPLFSRTLVTSITYLWARRNPRANVNLMFVPLQGQYLPFAHLAIALMMGNPIYEMLHGMLVGHIYYYLVHVVPTILGKRVLTTPAILVDVVADVFGPQQEFRQDERQQQQRRRAAAAARQGPGNNNNHNNGNDVRRRFQQEGATDAHIAAKLGRLERLRALAASAEGRASLSAKDQNDWQPLHEAVRGGYLEVVDFLLTFESVDKNARTSGGNGPSPLWIAESTHGLDHPVTRRLLELGAIKLPE